MNTTITSIRIFGTGCPTCKKLFETVKEVTNELGIKTQVEYVDDIQEIAKMGIMSSPAIAINGEVVLSGSIPNLEKIKAMLESYK